MIDNLLEYPERCTSPKITMLMTKDGQSRRWCHNCKCFVPANHAKGDGNSEWDEVWNYGGPAYTLHLTATGTMPKRKPFVKFTSIEG